jgi:hypothetical protein
MRFARIALFMLAALTVVATAAAYCPSPSYAKSGDDCEGCK